MRKQATVITGDIIQSSVLKASQRKALQQTLDKAFAMIRKQDKTFRAEQFRGDSFQGVFTGKPASALTCSLIIMATLVKHHFKARISIGTGEISFSGKNVVTSDGSAFQHSGASLDELKKKNSLLSVTTPSAEINKEWAIHCLAITYLIERWTPLQAEAVLEQLNGLTQEQTAKKLKIRQPAVNQRLQAAGWHMIDMIIARFGQHISSS